MVLECVISFIIERNFVSFYLGRVGNREKGYLGGIVLSIFLVREGFDGFSIDRSFLLFVEVAGDVFVFGVIGRLLIFI